MPGSANSRPTASVNANPSWDPSWSISRWGAASYLCVGLTLLIVLGLEIWGALHDLELVRNTFLESEMGRLRSHALRSVTRVQEELRETKGPIEIEAIQKLQFLPRHWDSVVRRDASRMYAAVVEPSGSVIMHTDNTRVGKRLGDVWYDHVVDSAGDDVVETTHEALSNGRRALDVRVPIYHDAKLLGNYHSGLRYDWLDEQLREKQSETRTVWAWILGGTVAIVLIAGVSLYQISRKVTVLQETVKVARVRRLAELGQLMAGIVHEIRNPLNAMRLNLHVLTRCQDRLESGREDDGTVDARQIIAETTQEIERVEGLMRIMLGYARPDRPHNEDLDLRHELQATLNFLKPMLDRSEVMLRARLPEEQLLIHMDRDRLRQIILNLVNNAKEATGPGGQIQIEVEARQGLVEVIVMDDGPGISPADREKVFEPFYSTKELGTGLGLALVRRFMDDVGGTVECQTNEPRGARFVLRFLNAAIAASGPHLPTQRLS